MKQKIISSMSHFEIHILFKYILELYVAPTYLERQEISLTFSRIKICIVCWDMKHHGRNVLSLHVKEGESLDSTDCLQVSILTDF